MAVRRIPSPARFDPPLRVDRLHQRHCGSSPNLFRIIDAGQARTVTYSHWLTPTNAVRIRNHGDTTAARSALNKVTVPAMA